MTQTHSAAAQPFHPHDILNVPASIRVKKLPNENGEKAVSVHSEDLTMLLVLEGSLRLALAGDLSELMCGDAAFINADRLFELCADTASQYYMICVNPSLFQNSVTLPNYFADLIRPSSPSLIILRSGEAAASTVSGLLRSIAEQDSQNLVPYRLHVMGCLHLMLAEFLSALYASPEFLPDQILPESRNLDRMLNYIHRNFSTKITLNEIAEAGSISRSRCSPIFRKYLHVTPIEYVNDYRLEVSRGYLLDRSASIASVASACGFSGQSYYTKLFVRKYGCTPTEYRARNA